MFSPFRKSQSDVIDETTTIISSAFDEQDKRIKQLEHQLITETERANNEERWRSNSETLANEMSANYQKVINELDEEIEKLKKVYNDLFDTTRKELDARGSEITRINNDWSKQVDGMHSVIQNFEFKVLDLGGEINSLKAEVASFKAEISANLDRIAEGGLAVRTLERDSDELRMSLAISVSKVMNEITRLRALLNVGPHAYDSTYQSKTVKL